jgi:hypothetical protein
MPKVQHPPFSGRKKSRPEYDIRFSGQYRPKDLTILSRVVFEIRILEENEVAGGHGNTRAKRRSFAAVCLMLHDFERGMVRLENA